MNTRSVLTPDLCRAKMRMHVGGSIMPEPASHQVSLPAPVHVQEWPRTVIEDELHVELLDLDSARVYVRGELRWTWDRRGAGRHAAWFDLDLAPGVPEWKDVDVDRVTAAALIDYARPEIGTTAAPFVEKLLRRDLRARCVRLSTRRERRLEARRSDG